MRNFATYRPRDLNLEVGVGTTPSVATFYVFNEPALNTFDFELAQARSIAPWRVTGQVAVEIMPLRDILSKHLTVEQKINFITVDVEGRDLDVLRSNDWEKYRPMVVVVEIFGKSMDELVKDSLTEYLNANNYVIYAKTVNTTFFVDVKLPLFQ